jgi:uncharacterized membrane protein SirB2
MLDSTLFNTLHLIGVALLFISLVFGGFTLFKNLQNNQPNAKFRKLFIAIQHLSLAILVVTGLMLLAAQSFQIETWFYAKIILFLVMVSSLIKAFKKDTAILLVQRRAGWVIAFVAFVAIYGLVLTHSSFNLI